MPETGSTLHGKHVPGSTRPLPLQSRPCLEAQPQRLELEEARADLTPGTSRQNQSTIHLFQTITLPEVWGSGGPALPSSPLGPHCWGQAPSPSVAPMGFPSHSGVQASPLNLCSVMV